jgi:hypothetical protein
MRKVGLTLAEVSLFLVNLPFQLDDVQGAIAGQPDPSGLVQDQ